MKKVLLVFLVVSLMPAAFGEIVQNHDFSAGLDSWSTWSSYTWSWPFAMNDPCTGDDLVRMCGWGDNTVWGCTAVWQDTGATYQPNTEYTLTVEWRDPSSAAEIVETVWIGIEDTTGAWTDVAGAVDGPAGAEDVWTTATLTFNTASDPCVVGKGIGVGFRTSSGTLAWVDINSISLVPEPATICLFGFGSALVLRRKRK
jgi:hypothetical protein